MTDDDQARIRELLAGYALALDVGDVDECVQLFAPDGEFLVYGKTFAGHDGIAGMFHAAARETYDVALCMYHDQALIPIKTLAFDHGVNVTLGLPFVRTSPDHGTAFDIAGSGRADPSSLLAALKLAARLSARTPAPASVA